MKEQFYFFVQISSLLWTDSFLKCDKNVVWLPWRCQTAAKFLNIYSYISDLPHHGCWTNIVCRLAPEWATLWADVEPAWVSSLIHALCPQSPIVLLFFLRMEYNKLFPKSGALLLMFAWSGNLFPCLLLASTFLRSLFQLTWSRRLWDHSLWKAFPHLTSPSF